MTTLTHAKPIPGPPAPTDPRVQREAAVACFRRADEHEAAGDERRTRIYRRVACLLVRQAGGVVDGGNPTP